MLGLLALLFVMGVVGLFGLSVGMGGRTSGKRYD
jgi:hypothetical protein